MDTESKTKLRRRLLKGGLAGPAVFTLPAATAWAASMSCLQRQQPPAGTLPDFQTLQPDQWMRRAVTIGTLGGSTAIQALGARVTSQFMVGSDGQYLELVKRKLGSTGGPVMGMVTRQTGLMAGTPGVVQQNQQTVYALIAYGEYGNELGLFMDGSRGLVALQSANMVCLNSVRAMAPGAADRRG
jgi:hypothetical protein